MPKSRRTKLKGHLKIAVQLPIAVFILIVAVAFLTHGKFIQIEDDSVRVLANKHLDSLRERFTLALQERALSLDRMARRLDHKANADRDDWQADADVYRKHLVGLDSLAVVDTNGKIRWISAGTDFDAEYLVNIDPDIWRKTIELAREQRRMVRTYDVEPVENSAVAFAVTPLFTDSKWAGSLVSVHRLDPVLKTVFKTEGYELEVREGDRVLFSNVTLPAEHFAKWGIQTRSNIVGQFWDFRLAPTPGTIAEHRSNLPHVFLVVAILTGLLLSTVIHLMLSLRKRSRAIEDQRRFLDTVIDNLPVAVFCKDHFDDMKFSVWNKKCEDLFGLPKFHTLGKTAGALFPDGAIRTLSEDWPVDQNSEGETSFEERVVTESSGPVLLQTRKIDIHDTSGQTLYTLGISEDVSQRRSAELALKDSEQKFSSFMENTPAMTWIRDENGFFTYTNSKFCDFWNVSRKHIVGQRQLPGVSPELIAQGAAADRAILTEKRTFTATQSVPGTDGRMRHLMVMKFPMVLASGIELLGGTSIDITDRVEAENTLAATTKTLKALIDSSPLPILTLDLQGLVTVWSPACEKVFGWTAEETIGKPLPFVPEHRRSESQSIINAIVEAGSDGFSTDSTRVRKDGTSIELRIDAMVLTDEISGKPTGLVAVMNDISQQKLAERKLQEAKRQAEVAAEMKSDFLANVSHEIRTPLNGIIGMTDILLESGLTGDQKKYAQIVHNSGAILLSLINDILDLSKIEAGKMTLEKTPFSLVSLVETNADLLIAKARENGLSLMTYVDSALPSQVVGDPSRLAQILMNLIGNAVKFTHSGGVTVRVSLDEPNAYDPSNIIRVCFQVQDTGIGLSETARKKLFMPFTQAESSTTRRFGGTGLGLSISKNLVETMGGTIGVDSVEGQGSTFWFVVPLERAASLSVIDVVERRRFEDTRVLIVDEDAIAADVVTRYLRSWGIHRSVCSTHTTALQEIIRAQANGEGYQLILIGQGKRAALSMTLAEEIQYGLGGKAPKIILMTLFEAGAERARLKSSQFAAVISKPLKQSELFDSLAKALHGHEAEEILADKILAKAKRAEAQPTSRTAEIATVAPKAMAGFDRGLSILLADDVSTNQIIALKLLESLGHSGHAVANGREALEALELHNYDIVLMDCQMPEMDGFEATRLIRASSNARTASVVIIALTANAMNGDRERCLAAGMNDYLAKPIKKDRLADMLNRWIPELKKHG